jgi:hypothetical protein
MRMDATGRFSEAREIRILIRAIGWHTSENDQHFDDLPMPPDQQAPQPTIPPDLSVFHLTHRP